MACLRLPACLVVARNTTKGTAQDSDACEELGARHSVAQRHGAALGKAQQERLADSVLSQYFLDETIQCCQCVPDGTGTRIAAAFVPGSWCPRMA